MCETKGRVGEEGKTLETFHYVTLASYPMHVGMLHMYIATHTLDAPHTHTRQMAHSLKESRQ